MRRLAALAFIIPLLASSLSGAEDTGFKLSPHRYTYIAGGIFLLAGLGSGYIAQGDAARAQSVTSALDTKSALQDAAFSSSTANILYCLAALTVAYGIVLEFLPASITEKGMLTFHF